MQVATALRIVSVVVAAKALLIGVVYWRRAEILGRPVHIGAGSWAAVIAVVTIGVAIALTVCVAARHQNGDRTPDERRRIPQRQRRRRPGRRARRERQPARACWLLHWLLVRCAQTPTCTRCQLPSSSESAPTG